MELTQAKQFEIAEVQQWDRWYRANFINSIAGFRAACLVGTVNTQCIPNLSVFSQLVHLGADPALVGLINRPRVATPHTLKNIEESGSFTLQHIPKTLLHKAHQTSAKYADDVSEFSAVGLTPFYIPGIVAPFVKECSIAWAAQLVEIVPITHNNTFLIIGKIQTLLAPETCIQVDGFVDISQAESVASVGLDAYYEANLIERIPYAKP